MQRDITSQHLSLMKWPIKPSFLRRSWCDDFNVICVFREKSSFFGNKTFDQRFGANLKKCIFCKNLLQISCFFWLFTVKNAENDYFDQPLECAAPKRWSKYTTPTVSLINLDFVGKIRPGLQKKALHWHSIRHRHPFMVGLGRVTKEPNRPGPWCLTYPGPLPPPPVTHTYFLVGECV